MPARTTQYALRMHGCLPAARRCAAALVIAFFVCGPDAHAVLVEKDGSTLRVTGESWQQNDMAITQVGMTIRVDDDGPRGGWGAAVDPWAGAGCERHHEPATPWRASYPYVTCSATGITRVVVTLQDHPEIWFRAYNGASSSPTDALQVPLTVTVGGRGSYVHGTPAAPNALTALQGASLVGGQRDDVLTGGYSLSGLEGDDELRGSAGPDSLDGGAGADKLFGEGGADTLITDPGGADVVDGGADRDDCRFNPYTPGGVVISLDGVANDGPRNGARTANVRACERVTGTEGPDLLTGSGADEELHAGWCCASSSGARDELRGQGGRDTLIAGESPALLDGGPGDDELEAGSNDQEAYGGTGTDRFTYSGGVHEPVVADLDGQSGDDGRPALGEQDTLGADIEHLTTGSGDDVLGGNAADNILDGRGGADEYDGAGGADTAVLTEYENVAVDLAAGVGTGRSRSSLAEQDLVLDAIEHVEGTHGPDLLLGSDAPNRLEGHGGDDLLEGGGGPDTLLGGPGVDAVSYADRAAPVRVDLAAGTAGQTGEGDALSSIEDVLGGDGPDTLLGDNEWNVLEGGDGADVLDGRRGRDDVYGDAGRDTIEARDGEEDYIECGEDGALVSADPFDVTEDCPAAPASPSAPPGPRPGPLAPPPGPPSPPRPVGVSTPPTAAPTLRVTRRFPASIRRGALLRPGMQLRVRCDATCKVSAVLRPKARARPLGHASVTSTGRRWTTVTVRPKRLPKRLRSVRVELAVTDGRGRIQRWTKVVKVR